MFSLFKKSKKEEPASSQSTVLTKEVKIQKTAAGAVVKLRQQLELSNGIFLLMENDRIKAPFDLQSIQNIFINYQGKTEDGMNAISLEVITVDHEHIFIYTYADGYKMLTDALEMIPSFDKTTFKELIGLKTPFDEALLYTKEKDSKVDALNEIDVLVEKMQPQKEAKAPAPPMQQQQPDVAELVTKTFKTEKATELLGKNITKMAQPETPAPAPKKTEGDPLGGYYKTDYVKNLDKKYIDYIKLPAGIKINTDYNSAAHAPIYTPMCFDEDGITGDETLLWMHKDGSKLGIANQKFALTFKPDGILKFRLSIQKQDGIPVSNKLEMYFKDGSKFDEMEATDPGQFVLQTPDIMKFTRISISTYNYEK